ncbi:MAG: helix-turn-helix domain-containing protein [Lachnospiraceae bacterium]|nr:helix-turn-helix domain-containing protein [Lachnospiraceae bacterium]
MAVKGSGYPQIDTVGTGKRLRYLSREKGISVQKIQHSLGLASNQAVYEWFNGKSLPTLNNFFALSWLFHTPMEDMLILQEEAPRQKEKYGDIFHAYSFCLSAVDYSEAQKTEVELILEESCSADVPCLQTRMMEYDVAISEKCA